ncbi:hypothetical protein Barb6_01555 [Bacteroidales bacterium Barb6]|nr:hypothetical protein Barb6_01555 [Bacteroidales bacterium Barb6]
MGCLRDDAGDYRNADQQQLVRRTLVEDGKRGGVGEDDLADAFGGRVAVEDSSHIGGKEMLDVGYPADKFDSHSGSLLSGIGAFACLKIETVADLLLQEVVYLFQIDAGVILYGACLRLLLCPEETGENNQPQQPHRLFQGGYRGGCFPLRRGVLISGS